MDSRSGISQIWVGVSSLLPAADLEEREGAVRRTGGPQGLGGGDLHGLVLALDHAELAADEHVQEDRRGQHGQRDDRRAPEGVDRLLRRRCQAETASMTMAPVTSEARTTCG